MPNSALGQLYLIALFDAESSSIETTGRNHLER
jgi:hypothetical protein